MERRNGVTKRATFMSKLPEETGGLSRRERRDIRKTGASVNTGWGHIVHVMVKDENILW